MFCTTAPARETFLYVVCLCIIVLVAAVWYNILLLAVGRMISWAFRWVASVFNSFSATFMRFGGTCGAQRTWNSKKNHRYKICSEMRSKVWVVRNCKGKGFPVHVWILPEGSRRLRLPGVSDIRHLEVARLSVLRTGRLYPPGKFLLLISVRLSRTHKATVPPEGLSQWKKYPIGNRTYDLPVCSADL
jgi:hypothetical protein